MDDIPTAFRETRKSNKSTSISLNLPLISTFLALGVMALLLVSFKSLSIQANSNTNLIQNQASSPQNSSRTTENNTQNNTNTNSTPEKPQDVTENLLGHLPYEEAPLSELQPITNDGRIKLRANAAQKFKEMQTDARRDGVILVPISGFRTVSEQEYLFFKIKQQRAQVATQRAEVSAPPGYSEHHTGYAMDIGDGRLPATNLNTNFEKTSAYQWLKVNAAKYSFELSFIPDNLQGVSYEPWHWRYVGDTHSLETFYKARNLKSKLQ